MLNTFQRPGRIARLADRNQQRRRAVEVAGRRDGAELELREEEAAGRPVVIDPRIAQERTACARHQVEIRLEAEEAAQRRHDEAGVRRGVVDGDGVVHGFDDEAVADGDP
jgi:hypothetical protein